MPESELKEADLDLLDSSVSQVDSSNSLKVPREFSEVNLENSSKRENSPFKHSSGSLENSESLQLDSLNSFLDILFYYVLLCFVYSYSPLNLIKIKTEGF